MRSPPLLFGRERQQLAVLEPHGIGVAEQGHAEKALRERLVQHSLNHYGLPHKQRLRDIAIFELALHIAVLFEYRKREQERRVVVIDLEEDGRAFYAGNRADEWRETLPFPIFQLVVAVEMLELDGFVEQMHGDGRGGRLCRLLRGNQPASRSHERDEGGGENDCRC